MKIKRKQAGDVMVLQLSGKIMGGEDQELFPTEIKNLINEGFVDVVLDMQHVEWINSIGIGILMSGFTTIKRNGGQMKFCALRERVENIFIVTQLKLVFETFATEEQALASFKKTPK